MASAKEPDEPTTPRRVSAAKKHDATTPTNRPVRAAVGTPKTIPAAGRQRSVSKTREPPSLLADFILGRQSHARIVAEKKRRISVEAVKAEMRQEMRQSSVQKLQQPGGVKDRVKQWQKTNAVMMTQGDPAATPSEPTDVAFNDEVESVTEEDRVRIKYRQRRKSTPKVVVQQAEEDAIKDTDANPKLELTPEDPRLKGPPKKRVVSDDHWMAKKNKKGPGGTLTPKKSPDPSPAGLPKSFSPRTAPNPPVSEKIKSWVKNVQPASPADAPHVRKHRSSKSADYKSENPETEPENGGSDPEDQQRPSRVRSRKLARGDVDDGTRVTPTRQKGLDHNNVGVKSIDPLDDGIRVRPMRESSKHDTPAGQQGKKKRPSTEPSVVPSLSLRNVSPFDFLEPDDAPSRPRENHRASRDASTAASYSVREKSPDDMIDSDSHDDNSETIHGIEDTGVPETPTRRRGTRPHPRVDRRIATSQPSQRTKYTMSGARSAGLVSENSSHVDQEELSDLASSAPTQSLADIPFGKSAFSEVDLPLGADAASSKKKPPKPQRNPSFSAVPKVFKKVVTEGKKIIHDTVDPPKPTAVTNPPSIETWLRNTVDPFVDKPVDDASPVQTRISVEKQWAKENQARRRSSVEASQKMAVCPESAATEGDEETVAPIVTSETPADKKTTPKKTPTSSGLKRKGATRATSSPIKSGSKSIFREALKDAFRGQSSNQIFPQVKTQPREEECQDKEFDEEHYKSQARRRSSGSQKRSPSPESEDSRQLGDQVPMTGPRRHPPTNGIHELSTIVSEESASSLNSETLSSVSQTTITQATALTGESELSRRSSRRSGLKRRLTKHSDLISVLSLPDDASVPAGVRNSRSRPSIRRTRSKADSGSVTISDLLREFAEDEKLYARELKTLVDGVVPVLLKQVLGDSSQSTALFGPGSPGRKVEAISKSVVSMGISLEKLRNSHRKAPLSDVHKLLAWLETVLPTYHSYLDAWRMGFEDLIVNLAPAPGVADDDDSLVNALPRNVDGDVINEHGERVDVAHLLKRPILRLRLMTKFVKVRAAWPSFYRTSPFSCG